MTDLEKLTIEQLASQIEYHNRKYWEEAEPEMILLSLRLLKKLTNQIGLNVHILKNIAMY